MNGLQEKYTYSINAEGLIDKELTGIELDENMYNYLPIAVAITATARKYLLETANTIGFGNIMYMRRYKKLISMYINLFMAKLLLMIY